MKIGYARVSTDDQKLDLQLDALRKDGCEEIFVDHGVSGSKTSRPGLDECLAKLAPGDQLCVYKLDRLGRSPIHLFTMLEDFGKRGINFKSLSEAIDTASPYGQALFGMLSVFAKLERDVLRERVKKGVDAYRARNPYWGPTRKKIKYYDGMSVSEMARRNNVSRTTMHKFLKEMEQEMEQEQDQGE